MRSIVELLIALAFVALFFFGLAYFLPQTGHVERTIVIERPASHVFDMVNSFTRFDQWSPWHKKDREMRTNVSGAEEGFGAVYEWASGMPDVAGGNQRIIESDPYRLVKIAHDWDRFAPATVTFRFKPNELGVQTTWSYDIDLGINPIMRYRGIYMDAAIGEDFQMGLMRLKALLESTPYARDYSDLDVEIKDLEALPALRTTGSITVYSTDELPDVPKAIDEAVATLNAYAARAKANVNGRPFVNILSRDRYSASFDVYLPVQSTEDLNPPKEIELAETFAGKFVMAPHWGRRNLSKVTVEKLQAYLSVRGMTPVSRPFEELVGELPIPGEVDADVDSDDVDSASDDPADEVATSDEDAADPANEGTESDNSEGADTDATVEEPETEFVTNVYFMLEPPAGEAVPPALAIPPKKKPGAPREEAGPAPAPAASEDAASEDATS